MIFTQGKKVAGPDLNNTGGNQDKETFHPPVYSLLSGFGEPKESSLKISLQLFFCDDCLPGQLYVAAKMLCRHRTC